jgi:molybdopterin-containing oxidoreductase family membrane subunit
MWLERFLIVIPSLSYKQLPYSWGSYAPRWPELTIMAATFAAMGLLYLVFSKFVPIISIWEMKAGEHALPPAMTKRHGEEAAVASPEREMA